ncbi:lysostaphin resistance A-like protein [Peribacillus sp. B-H-3]|uniref:CPBP family intramembrane glutamic endopeptidase n=1 Tax=Peribacillus sp. B-H-3 TaxID=3400420 RepID=UPI003B017FEC
MKREYWFVIITYIAMQLSGFVGVPILMMLGALTGASHHDLQMKSGAYWIVISFLAALVLVLFFMRHDMRESRNSRNQASIPVSIAWAVAGIFLALFSQSIASYLEQLFGISPGSKNTQDILTLIKQVPWVIFVSSVIGPILEEIIFRKIIFGSLHKRYNFFLSALISSFIFGLAHMEFVHILLYTAMGFSFAFLYNKTKRIWVSMFAHVAMNTLVVILQLFSKDIEKMAQNAKHVQGIIGGFL